MGIVSAVLVIHNEMDNLPKLLACLELEMQEIVIVDQESDDGSYDYILERQSYLPDKYVIATDRCSGYAESSRRYAHSLATSPWHFVIDGDEYPTLEFLNNIYDLTRSSVTLDYYICASDCNVVGYKPHIQYNLRLFKEGMADIPTIIHSGYVPYNMNGKLLPYIIIDSTKTPEEQEAHNERYRELGWSGQLLERS